MEVKLRESGIDGVGNVSWGTHFCSFYRDGEELIDLLIPYFKAGLGSNEYCMWVTSHPLTPAEAATALRGAVPDLDRYLDSRQIEIFPHTDWFLENGSFDSERVFRGLVGRLDQALLRGYAGLRISGNTSWLEKADWDAFQRFEEHLTNVIGNYRMMSICSYSLDRCGASEIIDVVNTHQFSIARRDGKWCLRESAEQRRVKGVLLEKEERYRVLFENMREGFAYCKVIFENGKARDLLFLVVNEAFKTMAGTKNVDGRKLSEVIPGIRESDPWMLENGGRASLDKHPEKFEVFFAALKHWYTVSIHTPEPGHIVAIFDVITKRKRAEETIRQQNVVLNGLSRILHTTLITATEEELGRACLTVAEEVTRSRFGFIGEIGPDGLMHDIAISDPGWDNCTMFDQTGHRRPPGNFKIHGLYGRVLRDGKGFFTNDPASHEDSIGTPAGHPPLTNFLGVPMIQHGKTVGMVAMANREDGYRAEDLDALTSLSHAIVQAVQRKRAEQALKSSLAEKEMLLRELAHRTKNNMQVIGSLLGLQAAASTDKDFVNAISDTQDRIRAMAIVHEKLYRTDNFDSVNLRDYLGDLMTSLLRAHQGGAGPVTTDLNLEDACVPIDAALPCGLIITELVSNSLKHAFPGRKSGTIFLSSRRLGERMELKFRDDGPGLPKDLDLSQTKTLGLKLVYNLAVRQLRGEMVVLREPMPGFVFTFGALTHMGRM